MRTTVGFCRSNLMYAVSGSLIEEQGTYIKRIHTLFPLKHPDVELCIQDGNENCKVKQVRVVRSIFYVRNFAFTLCWRERTSRPDNNLAWCRERPIFPFLTTATGERGWIYIATTACVRWP